MLDPDLPLPVCGCGCLLSGAKGGGDRPSGENKKISGTVWPEIFWRVERGLRPLHAGIAFSASFLFYRFFIGSLVRFLDRLVVIVGSFVGRKILDGKLAAERFFEGDNRFGTRQPQRLQFGVDNLQQVVVVAGVYFQEHIILTGGIVAFYDFGNMLQFIDDLFELSRRLQVHTDVGARLEADSVGVEGKFRTFDDAEIGQFLHALVYGCSRYIAFTSHFQERNARVRCDKSQNFIIEIIQLMMSHSFMCMFSRTKIMKKNKLH